MGDGSPLFHGALDLLAHACEHYISNSEKDRRFVILHLANSVELLLKDRLLDLGISIYENPTHTKSIISVLNDLQKSNINIPMKPIIELLIEERNNLQHRFGSPNKIMVKYYFDNCLRFFEEFMNAAFGLGLREYLSNLLDTSTVTYLYPTSSGTGDILIQARQVAKIHPSSAIMTAWIELEKRVGDLRETLERRSKKEEVWFKYPASPFLRHLIREYMPQSNERDKLRQEIVILSVKRNRVVHADIDVHSEDAEKYITKVEKILPRIDELKAQLIEKMKTESASTKKKKSVKK